MRIHVPGERQPGKEGREQLHRLIQQELTRMTFDIHRKPG